MAWTRTPDELKADLAAQISFLRRSCRAYDEGDVFEAVRIASAVSIILADRKRQTSILTQMGLRVKTPFVTPKHKIDRRNLVGEARLMSFSTAPGSGWRFTPKCWNPEAMTRMERIGYAAWWEFESIFRTPLQETITRKRLVESLRDQDGAGHLDPKLTDAAYVGLSRLNSMGWTVTPDGESIVTPLRGSIEGSPLQPPPHFVAMRQIGWEVDMSLILAGHIAGEHPIPAEHPVTGAALPSAKGKEVQI